MADIRLAVSYVGHYKSLVDAAVPHLVAAYAPYGVRLHIETGVLLTTDPTSSDDWSALTKKLTALSMSNRPIAPAHVVFASIAPGWDLTINGQMLNSARGICALFLGASSFQSPSPFQRLDLVVQVLIHEVGHLMNLTHGDGFRAGYSDAMLPTQDRLKQSIDVAWTKAVLDARSRGEPPIAVPSPAYAYPFGVKCRACLRAAASDPAWWPWLKNFRDGLVGGIDDRGQLPLKLTIRDGSLPEVVALGDGIRFTLEIANEGVKPIPIPTHIGPDFGTLRVTVRRGRGARKQFEPDSLRCSSARTVVQPGQTVLRSFSLIPPVESPLFIKGGAHLLEACLYSSGEKGLVLVGVASRAFKVSEHSDLNLGANQIASRLVASVRNASVAPSREEFNELANLSMDSTVFHHGRYKLAMLHRGRKRQQLLNECLALDSPVAVRHRAARQLAQQLLKRGWPVSKVLAAMEPYRVSDVDEELFETLERMGRGWNAINT